MQMEIDDLKRFSTELALVMDDIGVNEEMVSLRRHFSLLSDRYISIRFNSMKYFTFGSQSEGCTTIGMMSDNDSLSYDKIYIACVSLSDCQDSITNLLVVKEPMSLPQCCFLQAVVRLGNNTYVPMRLDFISATNIIENTFIIDDQGRVLFNAMFSLNSTIKFWDDLKLLRVQPHGPLLRVQRKGPACTLYNSDNVYAVRCATLPDNCRALFTRPRPGHWPTQATISKAEQSEVYMVHPGYQGHTFGYDVERHLSFIKLKYQHKYVDAQFRMSTNIIERLLMFDLNIVQMKAYVITKMIRKEFLQPLVDERLSTFHMKTALLFTIEQYPEDIWRDDNLVKCVILCLNTLKRFVKRGYCPHYTISSVNLFAGKVTNNELQIVEENVTEMIESNLHCLRKLRMDDVGVRLSASSVGLTNYSILSGTQIRYIIILDIIDQLSYIHYTHQFVRYTIIGLELAALALKSAIATDHEYKKELELIFHSMCSTIASHKASDCIANGRDLTSDIIDMYETSLKSKNISNYIKYASLLVCTRQFERADALLNSIEHMIISGSQIMESLQPSINVKPMSDQRSNKCTSTEILMKYAESICLTILFVMREINCVPRHLIYEKYRAITVDELNLADLSVDTRHIGFESDVIAFLYNLQYLSSNDKDTQRLALTKLSFYCEIKLQNNMSKNLATELNMLGNVIELENRLPDAWILYRMSVVKQPQFNAAYWHLFRLLGIVVYSKMY